MKRKRDEINPEHKKFMPMLTRTWDYVSTDAVDEDGNDLDAETCAELVLDAHRIENHGGADKALIAEFRALSFETQDRLALRAVTRS